MDDRQSPLPDYAAQLIRYKAGVLSRHPALASLDRGDISQILITVLIERLPSYDPTRARLNTFIARVVDGACISLIRYHTAKMRTREREECSLNDPVLDADGRVVDRHQTTPEATRASQRLHDLERDVAELRAKLPTDLLRDILDLLGRGGTVNSISIDLGIPRPKVKQQIAELRRYFEDGGLREYLA